MTLRSPGTLQPALSASCLAGCGRGAAAAAARHGAGERRRRGAGDRQDGAGLGCSLRLPQRRLPRGLLTRPGACLPCSSGTQVCLGEDPLGLQLRDFSQQREQVYLWFCCQSWDRALQPRLQCLTPPQPATGMASRTCDTYLKSLFCLEEFVPCLLSIP